MKTVLLRDAGKRVRLLWRLMFMESKNSPTSVSTNWVMSVSNSFELVLRQGASDQEKQALSFLA